MAKIRSYDSPQQSSSERGLNESGDARFAGDVAKSEQQMVGAATGFAESLYKRQAQSEVSGLNRSLAKAREDWTANLHEQIRKGTVDTESIREQYQSYSDKISQDITTPEARAFFEKQSLHLKSSLMKTAIAGQAQVAGQNSITDYSSALESNANTVAADPKQFQSIYDESMASLSAQVDIGPMSAVAADKLRVHTGDELAKGAIRGAAERNPGEAKRMLMSGEYDKYLNADTRAALLSHVNSEIRAKQDQTEKLLALKDKNPWEFLQKTGQAGAAAPLEFGDTVADSFQKRQEFIDSMDKKHGLQLPFMSEREADHTARAVLAMQPDQAVQAFSNIANGAQDQQSSKFALQLFKKEPGLAAAMMISGDAPDESRKVIAGMKLIRNGGVGEGKAVRAPGESDIEKHFDAYVGNAIDDAQTREAARQAISAHMTKSMFDSGKDDFREFSGDDFNKSAKAVMGPIININGAKVMSFRDNKGQFYNQSDLSDLVDGLTDKRVQSIQGDVPRTMAGEPINLEKSRGRVQLKSAGDGLYYMLRDSKPAWNKDKRPFILNLKAISGVPVTPDENAKALPGDYGL